MLVESATIEQILPTHIIARVIQRSTCGGCSAQNGCGQGVLSKYLSGSHIVSIALDEGSSKAFQVGSTIELGVDEMALLRGSIMVYLLPLIGLVLGAALGSMFGELYSVLGAVVGLASVCIIVNLRSRQLESDPLYSPVLLKESAITKNHRTSLI